MIVWQECAQGDYILRSEWARRLYERDRSRITEPFLPPSESPVVGWAWLAVPKEKPPAGLGGAAARHTCKHNTQCMQSLLNFILHAQVYIRCV